MGLCMYDQMEKGVGGQCHGICLMKVTSIVLLLLELIEWRSERKINTTTTISNRSRVIAKLSCLW